MRNNFIRKAIFKANACLLPRHCGAESYEKIRGILASGQPAMVARFGAVEIKAVLHDILPPPINICLHKWAYHDMKINAGFFPVDRKHLHRFSQLMLDDIQQLDILASWRPEEIFFKKQLGNVFRISLGDLCPRNEFMFWSKCLKNRKVLVVHPFADTIRRQYIENRNRIFTEPDILPEFAKLETVKAVQSIASNDVGFKSWFDALDYMKKQIDKHEYDVALIGCGAYGFPLAAYVKRMGKQAIHMGGVLQLLFGIRGKRWDNLGLYNDYWTSPNVNERPHNFNMIENGCYW